MARLAGAGNTLDLRRRRPRRVYNTDVGGLVWAVRAGDAGAGAAGHDPRLRRDRPVRRWCRWPSWAPREVTVVARTPAKAEPLAGAGRRARPAGCASRPWAAELPAGRPGGLDGDRRRRRRPGAELAAASAPVVFDVDLRPLADPAGRRRPRRPAATVLNGLDLLVGQALLQIELMTGRPVPAEVLYAAPIWPREIQRGGDDPLEPRRAAGRGARERLPSCSDG